MDGGLLLVRRTGILDTGILERAASVFPCKEWYVAVEPGFIGILDSLGKLVAPIMGRESRISSWLWLRVGVTAPDPVEKSLRGSLLLLSRERVTGLSSSCTGVGRFQCPSSPLDWPSLLSCLGLPPPLTGILLRAAGFTAGLFFSDL